MNPQDFLDAVGRRPVWQDDGLCAQTDPAAFYPELGESTRQAKQVCLACPVTAECLQYALEHQERFGVWGGTSERERRKLKPVRAKAPYIPPTPEQVAQVYELAATGLSQAKISAAVGVTIGTVKSLARAKRSEAA